jgi:hypothetical protein
MNVILKDALVGHPAQPAAGVAGVDVELSIDAGGGVDLLLTIHGAAAGLRIPEPCTPAETDGLWRHTCAELFVAVAGDPAYREFNFSPSGQWAAYHFSAYRVRARRSGAVVVPRIALSRSAGRTAVAVTLPAAALPPSPRLQVGISLVLEASDGSLSYWALAHAAGRPDFHRRETFRELCIAAADPACAPG